MKIHHFTALFFLYSFLMQSERALSEIGQNAGSAGTDAGFGMAKLSGGGMLAIIVLGLFGIALLVVICCASWSMIMTCYELRDRDKTNGGDSLEGTQKSVTDGGNFLFKSTLIHHPLAREGQVDSPESVV